MASQGFIELLRLSQRNAVSERSTRLWPGVSFKIADTYMTAPLGEVAEVINSVQVTAVPRTLPWFMGVSNLRGRLMSMCSFGVYLGLSANSAMTQKVLVIDYQDHLIGLAVDQVYGITYFDPDEFSGVNDPPVPKHHALFQGFFTDNEQRRWHIMLPSQLINQPEFLHATDHGGLAPGTRPAA